MKSLTELKDIKGKRVFYHPDYSVPMADGEIKDDYRILVSFPSLDYLMEQGAKIILGTKMGDPKGQYVAELALDPVAEYLADHYTTHAVWISSEIEHEEVTKAIAGMAEGDILILPNLRFYPGEQAVDVAFAKKLAALADVYVNDAFSVDHRADASLVALPALLPHYAGIQLEKEVTTLGNLFKEPAHPFVVVMGGAKVSDKIEVISRLAAVADHILIGGAMANTFLLAKGEMIGDSLAETDKVDVAKKLMEDFGDKLVLAADYVKDDEANTEHFKYLDIGEKAVAEFATYLKEAKTIFWNGSLGYTEDPKFAKASQAIAELIGSFPGVTSIVAGGDTVEMITQLKMHDKFTFVSTGGGAALEFLEGVELPGVKALE